MWELLPGYTPYLRKRFLVISAEDCFGVITKEIVALSEIGDEKALTQALAPDVCGEKNRDADYFVCNPMFCPEPAGMTKDDLKSAAPACKRRSQRPVGWRRSFSKEPQGVLEDADPDGRGILPASAG